ncbi:MAG: M28 family peptidase [Acidobacteriota bacterium]
MTRLRPIRSAVIGAAAAILVIGIAVDGAIAAAQIAAVAVPGAAATTGTAMLTTIEALTAPGMDGRGVGTPGGAKARAWIEARFQALGVKPLVAGGYGQPFSFVTRAGAPVQGVNLVAACPGLSPDGPVIVVSAHYDHLGVRNGRIYHGADDNASGVALLLAVAERCMKTPYQHTLVLAAFDAEEEGLRGAEAFLATPPIPTARIALDLNFDMVSRSDQREIYLAGPGRWPRLQPLLTAAVKTAPITVRFGHDTGGGHQDWTQQSDHGVFHRAGIPFVYVGVEDHADYHQPSDTADKIAPDFLEGVAAVVFSSLGALDRAPAFK